MSGVSFTHFVNNYLQSQYQALFPMSMSFTYLTVAYFKGALWNFCVVLEADSGLNFSTNIEALKNKHKVASFEL